MRIVIFANFQQNYAMRIHLLLIAACLVMILFGACKKDEDTADGESLLVAVDALDMATDKFKELGRLGTITPEQAIMETAAWLEGQEGIVKVTVLDSLYIDIETAGGLITSLQAVPKDSAGYSFFRGGGGGGALTQFKAAGGTCTDRLENNKVLLFAPVYAEFYAPGELAAIASTISGAGNGLDVTVLRDEQCTPDKVKDFGNYGLVIMDTHGKPSSFCTGSNFSFTKENKPTTQTDLLTAIAQQLNQDVVNKLLSQDYTLVTLLEVRKGQLNWLVETIDTAYKYNIYVTSKFVKSLPKMENTIIFANMCYSGFGLTNQYVPDPIRPAFMSLNPISYYAYAQPNTRSTPVSNDFAKEMERNFVQRLVLDQDSTRIVHLKPDNVTEYKDVKLEANSNYKDLYFKHFGNDTYCFGCGGNITDTRDGRSYKTVCIGNQVWMAEDLKYNAPGSYCYDNDAANCNNYGRLYNWTIMMNGDSASSTVPSGVQGICPTGWHIPSQAEWQILVDFLGGTSVAGGELRETTGWDAPNNGATNSVKFDAKPTGYYNTTIFNGLGSQVSWWTSTNNTLTPGNYFYVTTGSTYASISLIYSSKPNDLYLSCRCVKD